MAMYKRILVPVEHSEADTTILEHVQQLARLTGAELVLLHVADGWVARNFDELNLRESDEIRDDRRYLHTTCEKLRAAGFTVEARLAMGDPAKEIVKTAEEEQVDLVAMATHGHRFVKDMILGKTVDAVRHELRVPVLLLKKRESAGN
jgi:nucleotide-binding universal stress UspA family protein